MSQLVAAYPFVSKTLREVGKPASEKRNRHCCGVTLQNEGIGYDDLNELIRNPQDLEFTIGKLLISTSTLADYRLRLFGLRLRPCATRPSIIKTVINFSHGLWQLRSKKYFHRKPT